MPIPMQRAARTNCRRLIALALVVSFLFPVVAHAQENLPGLVSLPETSDQAIAPVFAGGATGLAGGQGAESEMWNRVLSLQTDQKVEVRLEAGRPTVKGRLVAADSGSITVLTDGTRQTLQRVEVRRVRAVRKGRERFQLFGILTMAAGGGIALATARSAAGDLSEGRYSGQGKVVLPVILIGAGAVIGTLGMYRPVYERRQP